VAGFGSALEVVDPPELGRDLARLGHELTAVYGDGGPKDWEDEARVPDSMTGLTA
jgi:hypothetical protein